MSSPLPLLTDFSDRLSPMVVKEMRQGLRTRFFTAALILFHVMLGLLMLGFLMDVRAQDAHQMFWVIIITTLLGVLPARAWNALHAEAKEGTLDMLVLTGISSFRIVWGKWVSLYSQTLLVVSSLLPYMIARYQLGGVEIVREIVGLYLLILGSAIITATMVAFSSQSLIMIRLLFSALVGAVAFGIGVYVFVLAVESSGERMWEKMMPKNLTGVVLLWLCITGLTAYLVYILLCIGSARLPTIHDNQGSKKRIVALIVLGLITTWILVMDLFSTHFSFDEIRIAMFILTFLTLMVGMDVLTEFAEPPFIRYSNGVKQARPFSWLTFIFYSGWPSGVFYYALICSMPFYTQLAISRSASSMGDFEALCFVSCILIANIIPVCIPILQKKSRLGHWLCVQLIVFGFGIMLGLFVNSMYYLDRSKWAFLMMITPATVIFEMMTSNFSHVDDIVTIGTAISLLWVLAAMFLAVREINRLRALAIASDSIPSSTDAELS